MSAITGEPSADLIREELEAQRDWWRSLENRALSLFASAGVIAGLAGIAGRGTGLPCASRVLLGLALGALAAGAVLGLTVTYPAAVLAAPTSELRKSLSDEQWRAPAEEHLRRASRARLEMIETTRKVNGLKTRLLRIGVWCAGAGIVLLLAAVLIALVIDQTPATA